jgi:3-hydroxypropanoate dehydrogenase
MNAKSNAYDAPAKTLLDTESLFQGARSQNGFLPIPISLTRIRQAYDLARMGPTSMNTQPMRLALLTSPQSRERLKPALSPRNVDKVMSAAVTAIVAYDLGFHDHLPRLFPHREVRSSFESDPIHAAETAIRNGTLQAAYFMMALRAVGLDVGAMSGFNTQMVDAEFFAGGRLRSNFLLNIGVGDPSRLYDRLPRLSFDEIAQVL